MKSNFKSNLMTMFCLTFSLMILTGNLVESTISLPVTYYPTDDWRTASPEEFGFDISRLDQMNTTIFAQDMGIDSIHIIRHGYLVYNRYFEYYNYSNLHHLQSVTKSVSSILIGIAQAQGFISDLDEPVLDIFTERNFSNVDSRKEALTIRHLLQMRSGLEWNSQDIPFLIGTMPQDDYENLSKITNWWDIFPSNPLIDWNLMIRSPDWVQFVLDKPMVADPGTEFYYNSGCSHLLSAIIAKKTGLIPERFAKQYLFDPLGITDYAWQNDSQDISMGGFGLWLQPIDMAKIGYLYLNNGFWNGEQILPQAWIQESTQDYSLGDGYGYQWWTFEESGSSYYKAIGFGGQFIIVIPDASVVVVITAGEFHNSYPNSLFVSYILQSIDFAFTYTETTTTTIITTTSDGETEVQSSSSTNTTSSTTPQTTNLTNFVILFGLVILFVLKKKE